MRILVVDDDEILGDLLRRSLSSQHHIVDTTDNGQMGWSYIQTGEYELVLLDIDLPKLDGISLCEKIRSQGYTIPILLMTAKDTSRDRITGLDAGADDYLAKPLDLDELNARVRALSRRGEVATTSVLNVNGLILDPVACEVSYQQQPIKLTAKEYNLLEIFLRNPAQVFSRSQILDKIWTFDDPPLEESVKAHIKGLRKKLRKVGISDWIENVYGIGYRLNPKADSSERVKNGNTSVEQEFERKMGAMWLKYQHKMRDRLEILQNAAYNQLESQLTPELKQNAERAAHKLAGVLGMFSRHTETEIARKIEILLQDNLVLSAQQQEFVSLVTNLDRLLALDETATIDSVSPENLLLISTDIDLARQLQRISNTQQFGWHCESDIIQANRWLQTNSPYVVAIDTTAGDLSSCLSLIDRLNARTPAQTILILSDTDSLSDRITLARSGVSSFLVKPVVTATIWQTVEGLIKQNREAVTSILIVDDDVVYLDALRSLLEPWGIKVSTLAEPLQFLEVLQAIKPDLVILDIEMPQIDGIELCQALRCDPDWQEIPVLFLTARQDIKTIQKIFEIGADDYISKPVVGAELIARINNRLDRSRLLHSLATQDRLTGLTNRIQSSRQIETILQAKRAFSLAVIKIIELEQINLKYGHATGDRILAQWGKVIQTTLRYDEITSYWSNGDFIIGMPNLNKTQAEEHLIELLSIFRKQIFTSPEGNRFQASFNCATAEFGKDGDTLHSLYQSGIKSSQTIVDG